MEPASGADVGDFGGLLDEFLAVHATPGHAHEGGQAYRSAAEAAAALGPAADEEAAVAVAKVCRRSLAHAQLGRVQGGSQVRRSAAEALGAAAAEDGVVAVA